VSLALRGSCRPLALALAAALLAGCGGSSKNVATTTTATKTPTRPGPGTVLYERDGWAVTVSGNEARAQHLQGATWRTDRSGLVKISILGPHGTVAARPQVAVELTAPTPLVESALWVDGTELEEKGGGLTPKRGTIYGAPAGELAPGKHLAVAYARSAGHATAVAWSFITG
jgi:hypothetical protein